VFSTVFFFTREKYYYYFYVIFIMRTGFGFNTNLLETNVLNVAVVVRIVVTVVGDSFRTLLDQRRQMVLLALKEVDKKEAAAQEELEEAQKTLEISRVQAQEVRSQARQYVERENILREQRLKEDLDRIKVGSRLAIQIEREKIVQSAVKQICDSAIATAEQKLLTTFVSGTRARSKQLELMDSILLKTF